MSKQIALTQGQFAIVDVKRPALFCALARFIAPKEK